MPRDAGANRDPRGNWRLARRIIRQLLTESVVLSLIGGVLGLAFGVMGIRALLSINTAGLPRVGEFGAAVNIDWRVLAFAFGVSLLTGIVFGLIPAIQSSRTDLTTTLKESSGRSGTGFRQNKARSVLVVTEVALALMLLIGSALLIRTAVALTRVDPGFDATNVLTMRMSLSGPQFQKSEVAEQLIQNGIERLRAVPGVVAASATCCVPLTGGYGLLHHRRTTSPGTRPLPRRWRMDDGFTGIFRSVQDSGEARPLVQR